MGQYSPEGSFTEELFLAHNIGELDVPARFTYALTPSMIMLSQSESLYLPKRLFKHLPLLLELYNIGSLPWNISISQVPEGQPSHYLIPANNVVIELTSGYLLLEIKGYQEPF